MSAARAAAERDGSSQGARGEGGGVGGAGVGGVGAPPQLPDVVPSAARRSPVFALQ